MVRKGKDDSDEELCLMYRILDCARSREVTKTNSLYDKAEIDRIKSMVVDIRDIRDVNGY